MGNTPSSAATLTVQAPPSITTQPANQTVNVGQVATFSVVASGTAPLSYQWQKNGTAINGATSASYTTPATTANDNGATFGVMVSNPAGNMPSNTAILTVQVPPSIATQPANQMVIAGQPATFSVVASGTAPLSYQWQKNGSAISGAISASYTTPATVATDNGVTFSVMVSNAAGNTPSNSATLTVQSPPSITTQPANQTVNVGQVATFSVVASGTAPLSYQWQKNGTSISGATSASYTTPASTTNDNGATFGVMVSNVAGNAPSTSATLTVQVPPSITTQPANQTVNVGQVATFSVIAAGTAPLTYQWQENGSTISGATSASYTTPPSTAADNASTFRVVVSNAAGNAPSSTATLTVQVPPSITVQPVSVTVTAGQTANFSVTAAGTSPLSYQWQENGANINGATSPSYATPAAKTSDNGAAFVVSVTNPAGSVSSGAATLTVNPDTTPPNVSITSPSNNATVSALVTVSANASDNIAVASVQFQVDGSNVGSADTTSPYNLSWDTTTYANGSHALTAIALDTAGNSAVSSTVNVTVSNQSSGGGGIPPALGWFDVQSQQQANNCPPNNFGGWGYNFPAFCSGAVRAWSGGIADTKRNRLWFWGGGHTDYAGNELYYFDLNSLVVARADDPAQPTLCNETMPDGSANTRHNYGALVYIPTADRMFLFGGGSYCTNGNSSSDTWTLDLTKVGTGSPNGWQRMDPTNGSGTPCGDLNNSEAAYDLNTGLVFVNDLCSGSGLWSYSYSTNTYAHLNAAASNIGLQTRVIIDPTRKLFLRFGDGHASKIGIASGSSYAVQTLTASGCSGLMNANAPGLAFDTVQNLVVGWPDFGGTIYLYNPDTDSCTTQTYSSSAPPDSAHTGSSSTTNGTFGRFQYFPSLGVFALINDYNIDAHTLRLTAAGGGNTLSISNVAATNITITSATISWSTSTFGTSQVMYGTTSSLGSSTTKDPTLLTTHSQTISGLTPSTLYYFSVQSVDVSGNAVTASGFTFGTATPDNSPPLVSITAPSAGANVSGTIAVTATASDNVAVASVQLQVDGLNSGSADTTSPYSFSLDTTTLTNANHTLTAVATDTSGNQATSAPVSITVLNQTVPSAPGYAGNGAGCPISNDDNHTSDHVTQYHCPLPNPTLAGNLLVLLLRYNKPAQTPSFTDNVGGNTYKLGVSCTDSTQGVVSAIYYVQGVRAGVNDIDVHLNSTQFVQMQPYEFFNAGTLDQATCQSGNGSTVSAPALNALTTSGDLVFQQAVVDSVQTISGCTKGSQSNITWTLRSAMIADKFPSCVQYGVYNSTASFVPSFTLGISASFVTAAAAFKPAQTGSAPASGIRVVYIQHDDTEGEQDKTVPLETPITGNMFAVLFGSGCLDPSSTDCAYPTSATDGVNTYIQIGPTVTSHFGDGGDAVGNVWYAKGVTPGTYFTTWTMHPRSSGGNGNTMFLYDIAGASSDPLDTNFGGAGNGLASNIGDQSTNGNGGNLTTITATPSQPNEVILITVGAGWNTFTGLTAPSGAQFLSSHYNTETNSSHCDLNGGWGLFYNGLSTSPESWTWTQDGSNFPGVGAWMSVGAAFH